MTESIFVDHLAKRFEKVEAVAGISFAVEQGELFGFLGPNGAGKTTTINMLTGLARPDIGVVRIGGIDCTNNPRAAQHLVGVVPDESNLYPELTGFENLCFCAALYGMGKAERQARARELLDVFGLTAAAKRKFGGYSKGMKRKLTIAAGIIHQPSILFLDEPTTGIDVASARHLRQLVADLHRTAASCPHSLRTADAGQDQRGHPVRRGQRFRACGDGCFSGRPVRGRLAGFRACCDHDRRRLHLSGPVHRRGGERGVRGANLFQLLPFPHDLSVRAFFPHREAARFS
jgi:ABC-type Na+ transport system ATPase subunit NatA